LPSRKVVVPIRPTATRNDAKYREALNEPFDHRLFRMNIVVSARMANTAAAVRRTAPILTHLGRYNMPKRLVTAAMGAE
jgi:hypothetical protein